MSIKTGRKIGFFAAISMLIGSVIGIGIFLKNHSVLSINQWSGTGTLVSWLVGGLLALAAAISFSDMSMLKSGKTVGLMDWSEKFGGKKLGYFVRFNFSFFYFALLLVGIAVFAAETLVGIFIALLKKPMPHFGVVALVALILLALVIAINYISIRAFGIIQITTTILKFIPLVLVGILGIILAGNNFNPHAEGNSLFGQNAFTNGQPFDFTKMLAALPSVLFAYDAFLTSSAIRNRMKKEEQLPLVTALGMIIVISLYTLIAISAILHGSGMVSGGIVGANPEDGLGIFDQILPAKTASWMGTVVIIFLFFSIYGVLNGVSMGFINTVVLATETNTFFGSIKMKNKYGKKAGLFYLVFFLAFYFLIAVVPGIVMNNDAIVDAFSNFPTLFFFAIYALVIALYRMKKESLDLPKQKLRSKIAFKFFSFIAILGIGFVFAYQFGYGLTLELLQNPHENSGMGLFAKGGSTNQYIDLSKMGLFFVFISSFILFITLPTVNVMLIRKFENRNPFISTQHLSSQIV